jgi:hypothetical protein
LCSLILLIVHLFHHSFTLVPIFGVVGVLMYACACPWSSSCVSVVWVRVCCEGPCWRGACAWCLRVRVRASTQQTTYILLLPPGGTNS